MRIVTTVAAAALVGACGFGIDPAVQHISVTGTVTLDGAPAVGWGVAPINEAGLCSQCRGAPTNAEGEYFWGSDAAGVCDFGWRIRIEPPDSLAGGVTPPFGAALECGTDNVRDFAFASTGP